MHQKWAEPSSAFLGHAQWQIRGELTGWLSKIWGNHPKENLARKSLELAGNSNGFWKPFQKKDPLSGPAFLAAKIKGCKTGVVQSLPVRHRFCVKILWNKNRPSTSKYLLTRCFRYSLGSKYLEVFGYLGRLIHWDFISKNDGPNRCPYGNA